MLGLMVAVLPHLANLPAPVMIGFYALLGWGWWLRADPSRRVPPAWLRLTLIGGGVGGVLVLFGTVFGRNPGVSLLVLLTALKLIELRTRRDAVVALFLGYFLVITNLLFSQVLPIAGLMLGVTWYLVAVHVALSRIGKPAALREDLRRAGAMLIQALPMVAVLFVLFPRIEGSLWGLPKDAYSGMTGLSNRMEPGNITRLAQSDEVAFRARFADRPPPRDRLYWRGPVMWQTDGRAWTPGRHPRAPGARLAQRSRPVAYTVTLEPHNRRWLLALDLPAPNPHWGRLTNDYRLVADKPVRTRIQYRQTSFTEVTFGELPAAARAQALQLPDRANPRTLALGRSWQAQGGPQARVQAALDHFRRQPYYYTLTPPALGVDAVDQFLFDTRRGYCEHYAGAFVYLMRAAGVPARVVTGYQGGELNPLGGYLIVRQLNAHAWAEAWLEPTGWTRIDPTAVLPVERIELPDDALVGRQDLAERLGIPPPDGVTRLIRQLGRAVDAVSNRWNEWVLGYGRQQQDLLLSLLGLGSMSWTEIGLLIVAAVSALLLLAAVRILWVRRGPRDPVTDDYRRFCRRLARCGLARAPGEAPSRFAARVAEQLPGAAAQAQLVTKLYIALRYGPERREEWLRRLHRAVRRFRP
jgi:transglutaminase-like putative cysteine protease